MKSDYTTSQLKKICVMNFKAFGEYTELVIDKLTVLAGLNSSGKSSIYQSLLLIEQSEDTYILDINDIRLPVLKLNGSYFEFGEPDDILHNKEIPYVMFRLIWDDGIEIELIYSYKTNITDVMNYETNYLVLSKYKFIDNISEMSVERNDSGKWNIFAKSILSFQERDLGKFVVKNITDNYKTINQVAESVDDISSDIFLAEVYFEEVSSIDFRNVFVTNFTVSIDKLVNVINPQYLEYLDISDVSNELNKIGVDSDNIIFVEDKWYRMLFRLFKKNKISYIPPFRGYPRRVYTSGNSDNPLSTYSTNKSRIIPYKVNPENGLTVSGTVQEALHFWVVDQFELADKIGIEDIIPGLVSEIYLEIGGKKISINNVGFGTSQVVPVIYKILVSMANIFIVDEPEIHLHASKQSKLATFFFEMMLIGKTIIIETHSEYLIDKLIYHNIVIHDKEFIAKMYWVKTHGGNESTIELIEHDNYGYIINPPAGFMSEKKLLVEAINKVRMSTVC